MEYYKARILDLKKYSELYDLNILPYLSNVILYRNNGHQDIRYTFDKIDVDFVPCNTLTLYKYLKLENVSYDACLIFTGADFEKIKRYCPLSEKVFVKTILVHG